MKQTYDEIREQLKSYELVIEEEENGNLCVRTFEDRSVGIYGDTISPTFKNMDELINWWNTIVDLFFG
jgi:hypothetical protein